MVSLPFTLDPRAACSDTAVAVQEALHSMQKQLGSSPPEDTFRRMSELEGALKQAVKDYESLLRELVTIRADARQKDSTITALEAELASATDASASQR